jgi:hypothetical protein
VLHVRVLSSVVVKNVKRRLGVRDEHHGRGANEATESELGGDDGQKLELRDRVAEQR